MASFTLNLGEIQLLAYFFTFILGLTNMVGKIWKNSSDWIHLFNWKISLCKKIFLFTFLLKYYRKCTRAQIVRVNVTELYIQTHQRHHHINSNTWHSNTIRFSHALSYSPSHPEETVFQIFITINSLMYSLILYKWSKRVHTPFFSHSLLIISLRFIHDAV